MLDDRDAGGCGDNRCRRRDIDRAVAVTAGSDDVQNLRVDRKRQRGLQDRVAETDDFVDGLPLGTERDEESSQL